MVFVLSLLLLGCTVIPVDIGVDQATLDSILARALPTACFCYTENKLLFLSTSYAPKLILCTPRESLSRRACILGEFTSIATAGREYDQRTSIIQHLIQQGSRRGPTAPVALIFTSGTSGTPKGVLFTDEFVTPKNPISTVQPFVRIHFQSYDQSFILSLLSLMKYAGCVAFSRNGAASVLDDMQYARPTNVGAPPVFWNTLYKEFCLQLTSESKGNPKADHASLQQKVAQHLAQQTGNRIKIATSGGAPISREVVQFMRDFLHLHLEDLYGTCETSGIASNGTVYPGVQVQILPLPGEEAQPNFGEICVHSPRIITEYWKDPEGTAKSFTTIAGKIFYRTGDVGSVVTQDALGREMGAHWDIGNPPRGDTYWKWVPTGILETLLEEIPIVGQALVIPCTANLHTVAVIVPSGNFHEFWDNEISECEANTYMLHTIDRWCRLKRREAFEIPHSVLLERSKWSSLNGLVTGSGKKKRFALLTRYKSMQISCGPCSFTVGISSYVSQTLSSEFTALLQRVLPSCPSSIPIDSTFAFLGGNSLCVGRLATLLFQHFGLHLPPKDILSLPLHEIADMITTKQGMGWCPATSTAKVVGAPNWQSEWTLRIEIDPLQLEAPRSSGIFLTGGTGFLGTVILCELLALGDVQPIYCLVRASTTQEGGERLFSSLRAVMLGENLLSSAHSRVVPVLGDLSKEYLGMDVNSFRELATSVDCIIHCGSKVSAILPYSSLKGWCNIELRINNRCDFREKTAG
ncbi:fatty-acid-coa ligase FadD [Pelomyxa schiedti]|nr:fatty-acid-coa ligase FadD [Pelomyxa schiedti]